MVPKAAGLPWSRRLLLGVLFFLICCGLGYSILNRIEWRKAPGGLQDLQTYANMIEGEPARNLNGHMQFRVLVPGLARGVYRVVKDHTGTWDPIMLSLLLVNAFLVAATVVVLMTVVYGELGDYAVALGSALFYLLNFAVPNLRLIGFIDAGEGLFLMLAVWSLWSGRMGLLPVWAVLGTMAKETFVPFLAVFAVTWWLCSQRDRRAAMWIVVAVGAAFATLTTVHWKVSGVLESPLRFGRDLHQNSEYLAYFFGAFRDRNLWYIFVWLLPLGLLKLNRFPRSWRVATGTTCAVAFALDVYYGGAPGTVGRALFTIAGPLLSASVALLVFTGVGDSARAEVG